ncbi:MAG: hypothetical protein AB7E29_08375 [Xanthobacter sp.]
MDDFDDWGFERPPTDYSSGSSSSAIRHAVRTRLEIGAEVNRRQLFAHLIADGWCEHTSQSFARFGAALRTMRDAGELKLTKETVCLLVKKQKAVAALPRTIAPGAVKACTAKQRCAQRRRAIARARQELAASQNS